MLSILYCFKHYFVICIVMCVCVYNGTTPNDNGGCSDEADWAIQTNDSYYVKSLVSSKNKCFVLFILDTWHVTTCFQYQ